jgi:hypothetical protein
VKSWNLLIFLKTPGIGVSKIRLLECACIFSPGIFRQKSNEMSTERITASREAITSIELSSIEAVLGIRYWVLV